MYSDIWGPAPFSTINGACYYIHLIDAYSRYTWIFLLHSKSQVYFVFLQFKKMIELQLATKLKALQTDNAREYVALSAYLKSEGIVHRFSCPYVHQQNGVAERKHRHVTTMGLTLLAAASMPLLYWGDAFLTAAHLINLLPTPLLQFTSPTKLFNHKPSYDMLKVFGCLYFPHTRPYNKHKLDFRYEPCVFLGYAPQYKGYKCLARSGKMFTTQHVVFDESVLPFRDFFDGFLYSTTHTGTLSSKTVLAIPLVISQVQNSPVAPSTLTAPSNLAPAAIPISVPEPAAGGSAVPRPRQELAPSYVRKTT